MNPNRPIHALWLSPSLSTAPPQLAVAASGRGGSSYLFYTIHIALNPEVESLIKTISNRHDPQLHGICISPNLCMSSSVVDRIRPSSHFSLAGLIWIKCCVYMIITCSLVCRQGVGEHAVILDLIIHAQKAAADLLRMKYQQSYTYQRQNWPMIAHQHATIVL